MMKQNCDFWIKQRHGNKIRDFNLWRHIDFSHICVLSFLFFLSFSCFVLRFFFPFFPSSPPFPSLARLCPPFPSLRLPLHLYSQKKPLLAVRIFPLFFKTFSMPFFGCCGILSARIKVCLLYIRRDTTCWEAMFFIYLFFIIIIIFWMRWTKIWYSFTFANLLYVYFLYFFAVVIFCASRRGNVLWCVCVCNVVTVFHHNNKKVMVMVIKIKIRW